ncbi:hypothetical protein NCU10605 [Neurospora crassa OR74A]|uniref:Uncharacterized protein n=1 Tax=Neurospora crassa (strain ATCC 24698 / 74-OR23-1A / CBS 708.71 / DSM 1257 / FGSC 987) TaxID=367110 RepID=A7UXG6_NEUCR|nr:hypothetical protein NCU10605 [Neurospora crassa OR74A]EDO64881.2 hypothetical protein NCU10605 [Neurospora crassa OR74A]|eukprot:XP_001727972.2 hypothetical protein NCU10605 [Neurospora crassa OR74A]
MDRATRPMHAVGGSGSGTERFNGVHDYFHATNNTIRMPGQASSIISCGQPYLPPSGGVRHNLLSSDRALKKPLTPQGSADGGGPNNQKKSGVKSRL